MVNFTDPQQQLPTYSYDRADKVEVWSDPKSLSVDIRQPIFIPSASFIVQTH
jgi:hypothetical protein